MTGKKNNKGRLGKIARIRKILAVVRDRQQIDSKYFIEARKVKRRKGESLVQYAKRGVLLLATHGLKGSSCASVLSELEAKSDNNSPSVNVPQPKTVTVTEPSQSENNGVIFILS